MITRDAKEYPETIPSEIQGGRPLHFLRLLSWYPLLRPVLPTHLARDHMARARASHEASAHAKRWPPERFPGAGQLRRYDPALACSRTSKERLLLRLPHWPAVIRLLFSLASAGNFIRHWASAGFAPSPHWPVRGQASAG